MCAAPPTRHATPRHAAPRHARHATPTTPTAALWLALSLPHPPRFAASHAPMPQAAITNWHRPCATHPPSPALCSPAPAAPPSAAGARRSFSAIDCPLDCSCLGADAPFYSESSRETADRILNHEHTLTFPPEARLSAEAISLIRGLIRDRSERLAMGEIKAHPFFASTDWGRLREATPPHTPQVRSAPQAPRLKPRASSPAPQAPRLKLRATPAPHADTLRHAPRHAPPQVASETDTQNFEEFEPPAADARPNGHNAHHAPTTPPDREAAILFAGFQYRRG